MLEKLTNKLTFDQQQQIVLWPVDAIGVNAGVKTSHITSVLGHFPMDSLQPDGLGALQNAWLIMARKVAMDVLCNYALSLEGYNCDTLVSVDGQPILYITRKT